MAEGFASALTDSDWNAEWKRFQEARKHFDSPAVWDEKAKTFPVKHGAHTDYADRFLQLAGVRRGESVLDMGCGTGALATPLARDGHRVVACDFSQGMLDVMVNDQAGLGVDVRDLREGRDSPHGEGAASAAAGASPRRPGGSAGGCVDVRVLRWDDDWDAAGVGPKCVDVAIASRSIATYDLRESLMKLDRAARRRVCVTLPCGPSPRIDERLLEAAGFGRRLGRDFLYAFNILASEGINPEVAYIPSVRMELFDTFDEAVGRFSDIVEDAVRGLATPDEVAAVPERMRTWLEGHLVHDDRGFHLSEDRVVTWAFMAWQPR